ncbi:MAG: lytic murein transglycosylase [Aeromicrobium sp.]|uniref:lytic transglycosylase domain-containing protein n=1 Tax=Aeromicrobium sp. TaxID=1871063 RepID=UPI003C315DA4
MMRQRDRLILTVSGVLTAAVLTGWFVVQRDDDAGPSGPAPRAAERVPAAAGSPTEPDEDWVAETAKRLQIPRRAMLAYATTELTERVRQPKCQLRWNTLAAIGSVESAHGTLGGAGLSAAGVPDEPIIGPALDGTNGTRAIPATAASADLHGDDEWDHAVGPFQFLTSSWERYGGDADGDGMKNPNDIDDAALGASRHLCLPGGNVAADNWVPAVYGYNNSMAYVDKVRDIANAFAR